MKPRDLPSKELLDQVLKYDPDTGMMFWRPRPVSMFADGNSEKMPRPAAWACNQWNSRWAGKPAATLKPDGYWYVHFNYRTELAHRLAYKIMTGLDPVEVDHIDGNRGNNKWSNLKNGTRAHNMRNLRLRSSNKSGYHGVHFSKRQQKWVVTLTIGSFDNKDDAVAARKRAEEFFGFHANHGKEALMRNVKPGKGKPAKPGKGGKPC